MAYGTVAGVANLSSMWTNSGAFDATTKPTATAVTGWLTDVSSMLDTALADEGFVVPITDGDITPELDLLVEGIVSDLVAYSHKSGRFYTTKALEGGISPFMTADKELHEWVKRKTIGLEALGAEKNADVRPRSAASIRML